MTVRELIEALQKLDMPDAEVLTEGCDCYGNADGVANLEGFDGVLITRSN